MKNGIKPPSIADICERSNMSAEEVSAFLELLKRSMEPFSKRISVVENGTTRYYAVERRGIGILKTEHGKFWHYNFAIDDQWEKYSVMVKAEFDKSLLVPVFKNKDQLILRTDSGCETGQIFGDLTCECHDQLHLALKTIEEVGEGMLINIPRQDGRGMGLTFKLATLWVQDVLGVNTVESASLLAPGGVIDIRTYSGVICILKFFGIPKTCRINLATNNPKKADVFAENGYTVADYTSVVIEPNEHTRPHCRPSRIISATKASLKKEMKMKANEQILERMIVHNTLLCCGLDPDLKKMPSEIIGMNTSDEKKVLTFLRGVVDATAPHVCAFKAQKAFFDVLTDGHDVLKKLIDYIHTSNPGIPVIVDCKIGDIENTMEAYIQNLFGSLQADGVVVNPYMGDDVMLPLVELVDKSIVVLVKTSNPSGGIVQDVVLQDGQPLWRHVLNLVVSRWNRSGNMIPVLSSTVGLDMEEIRAIIPDKMPILLAGVGVQGGSYANLRKLLNSEGVGVFVNSSRGILYPQQGRQSWQSAVEKAAIGLKESLNKERGQNE